MTSAVFIEYQREQRHLTHARACARAHTHACAPLHLGRGRTAGGTLPGGASTFSFGLG